MDAQLELFDPGLRSALLKHPHPAALASSQHGSLVQEERFVCRDVDGPGDRHTEWSKSEREKLIWYINTYMWNLEKWDSWPYLQGRGGGTDAENRRGMEGVGRVGWDELGE